MRGAALVLGALCSALAGGERISRRGPALTFRVEEPPLFEQIFGSLGPRPPAYTHRPRKQRTPRTRRGARA